MSPSKEITPEYQTYQSLEHWQSINQVLSPEELFFSQSPLFPLFSYLYTKVKQEYLSFPLRKNGFNPFLHPLNVVWDLKRAKVEDEITLCVGLLHDLIEEKVDFYKREEKISEDDKGKEKLDFYEEKIRKELEKELQEFCQKEHLPATLVEELIIPLQLLTRLKRHFYYRSISSIFNCQNSLAKERAIQVKLADRIHNILCLECFNEQEMTFQCFKNLFILNNIKKYLKERFGEESNPDQGVSPTEKLFKKCAKATFDAFLKIRQNCIVKGVPMEVKSTLQLALIKFTLEKGGLWAVTEVNKEENHPFRLFQGIVRKYDARLHQEWDYFNNCKEKEIDYCRKFFSDFDFSPELLQVIIEYKDAYGLSEVITYLLYKKDYLVAGFGCSEMCSRKKKCQKE